MSYRITIIKTEPNPHFAEELEHYHQNNRIYDRGMDRDLGRPLEEVMKNALMVELTDEQYKKVKVEILREFE